MDIEIEAKWLRINKDDMRDRLKEAGATLVHAERRLVRKVYDFPNRSLQAKDAWLRVRDEGDKVTLTYKQWSGDTISGTKEVNLVVNDFSAGCQLLESLDMKTKAWQETLRESWTLDGAEIEIDTWPWIQPLIEIEAGRADTVWQVAAKLGLQKDKALFGGIEKAYMDEFAISSEQINSHAVLKFGDTPPETWKRR